MRSIIEWGRIKRMRGMSKSHVVFGVEEFFEVLRKRLDTPVQRLKEGFVLTPEEVDEIHWRHNGAI